MYKSINVINNTNGLKDKNQMKISVDADKAFNKIQCALTIKVLERTELEETHPRQ